MMDASKSRSPRPDTAGERGLGLGWGGEYPTSWVDKEDDGGPEGMWPEVALDRCPGSWSTLAALLGSMLWCHASSTLSWDEKGGMCWLQGAKPDRRLPMATGSANDSSRRRPLLQRGGLPCLFWSCKWSSR